MNTLPGEILFLIFSHLDYNSRFKMSDCCKKLKDVHKYFVKSKILPKLIKRDPLYNRNKIENVDIVEYEINDMNIPKFQVTEIKNYTKCDDYFEFSIECGYNSFNDIFVFGESITKIELYSCENIIHKNFYLKNSICIFKPTKYFLPYQIYPLSLKVYAKNVNKIFIKNFYFSDTLFLKIREIEHIISNQFIYHNKHIHLKLRVFNVGLGYAYILYNVYNQTIRPEIVSLIRECGFKTRLIN